MTYKEKAKCKNNKIKEFNCGKIFYLNSKNFIRNYLELSSTVSYPMIVNVISKNNNKILSFPEEQIKLIIEETLKELK